MPPDEFVVGYDQKINLLSGSCPDVILNIFDWSKLSSNHLSILFSPIRVVLSPFVLQKPSWDKKNVSEPTVWILPCAIAPRSCSMALIWKIDEPPTKLSWNILFTQSIMPNSPPTMPVISDVSNSVSSSDWSVPTVQPAWLPIADQCNLFLLVGCHPLTTKFLTTAVCQ